MCALPVDAACRQRLRTPRRAAVAPHAGERLPRRIGAGGGDPLPGAAGRRAGSLDRASCRPTRRASGSPFWHRLPRRPVPPGCGLALATAPEVSGSRVTAATSSACWPRARPMAGGAHGNPRWPASCGTAAATGCWPCPTCSCGPTRHCSACPRTPRRRADARARAPMRRASPTARRRVGKLCCVPYRPGRGGSACGLRLLFLTRWRPTPRVCSRSPCPPRSSSTCCGWNSVPPSGAEARLVLPASSREIAPMEIVLFVLAGLLILIGLAGTLLPALPGIPLVMPACSRRWADHFQHIGWVTLTVPRRACLIARPSTSSPARSAPSAWARAAGRSPAPRWVPWWVILRPRRRPGRLPFAGARWRRTRGRRHVAPGHQRGPGNLARHGAGRLVKVALAFTMLGVFAVALLFG